ncbi:glycerophosphoryl diester phosphodiesterase [Acrocarpospora pleiomorpha]|uniref:Glycerophosphoryl diester phosphodiesterase n=1 Tax=Acrocarpospora pleiomorpha TaxID=90975 RepID=A0A5M3XPE9_9ACTN|nr:glycerophosphodiester phosphodiesterase [Acrocarpospora pleiomorpha]GES21033.1 glycerophosphoryl diester phosphodiesterase [Acrocarpospora pleiomorpha]
MLLPLLAGGVPRTVRPVLAISSLAPLLFSPSAAARDLTRSPQSACEVPGLISHRGWGTENTLTAFRRALDAGSDRVELDVRFTKDHHPVLMHDATVDRTTTTGGRVSDMTLARFRTLRTSDGQHPPTLGQALQLLRGRTKETLVELKEVPDAADLRSLRELYQRFSASAWASLTSFLPSALRAVDSIPARKGLLSVSAPPVTTAKEFSFVAVRYDNLSRTRVRAYRAAGATIYAWTPNSPRAWERLGEYGVHQIVTDQTPDYLAWAAQSCQL